ncbi:hypothetical protein P9250_19710 [Caballeronia sp. LP006]|uniref:hypothetical protein n=1 Tax=Caballeronia sp. LP006 TaxID=3038552 RepID=UPI00285F9F9F|nr:hypothetical protein [Caballeronia sp. LP006]MDR5830103.1 hypothetical protein [Caballeronia sp. LP006]
MSDFQMAAVLALMLALGAASMAGTVAAGWAASRLVDAVTGLVVQTIDATAATFDENE